MSAALGVLGQAGIELVPALVRIVDLCLAALYGQIQAKIVIVWRGRLGRRAWYRRSAL
jgi:hypothetical protein